MKKFALCVCGIAAAFALAAQASADVLAYYSFTNATIVADTGSGISAMTWSSTGTSYTFLSGLTQNAQPGFVAGNAFSQNGWVGDASYFQFTLDTTGYSAIGFSYAANRSSTGPATTSFQYSSNGGSTWTEFSTFATPSNAAQILDLSGISALDNNASVQFRIIGIGSTAATGTMKIDNVLMTGIIPEPSTILLVGAGLLGLLALRRRS